MIDFACKRFDLREIIKCSLGLTKADCKLMMFLIKDYKDWHTTEDLSKKLKINLSTAQRAVKKLTERGIVIRSQENLTGGGYVYIYKVKNKKEISQIIMNIVGDWVKKVESEFDKW